MSVGFTHPYIEHPIEKLVMETEAKPLGKISSGNIPAQETVRALVQWTTMDLLDTLNQVNWVF